MLRPTPGVSLLELLVVVAIVAILCSLAIVPALQVLRSSREGRAIADLRTIADGEMSFYASNERFAVFEDLFRTQALSGQFQRGAAGALGGATEAICDGSYLYTVRFAGDATGITIDADPRPGLTSSYRRFRMRMGRIASGRGGSECVLLVAPPSAKSPPTSAYRPLGGR